MKKSTLCFLAALLSTMLLFVHAYSQEDMQFVDNTIFQEPARTQSVFQHDQHNDTAGIEECNLCHHVYANGQKLNDESSEDQRCSDCHKVNPSIADSHELELSKAFHTNCKGCHKTNQKGPILCGQCHIVSIQK